MSADGRMVRSSRLEVGRSVRRSRARRVAWMAIGVSAVSFLEACQSTEELRPPVPELIILAAGADERAAEELVDRLRERHGVVLGSGACSDALRRLYAAPDAKGVEGMRSSPWRLAELAALERAMIRYAP